MTMLFFSQLPVTAQKVPGVEPKEGKVPFLKDIPILSYLHGFKFLFFKVTPTLRQELEFNDNIFLNDKDVREGREFDIISRTFPGASVGFVSKLITATATASALLEYYMEHDELSSTRLLGELSLDLEFNILKKKGESGRVFFLLDDDVAARTSPVDIDLPRRLIRYTNTLKATIGYELKRGEIRLNYINSYVDFVDDDFHFLNALTHGVSVDGKYKLTDRLAAVAALTSSFTDFQKQVLNDVTNLSATAGLQGTVTDRLSMLLSAGYQFTERTDDHNADDEKFSSFITKSSITYDVGPRTQVVADVAREVATSPVSNFKVIDLGRISLRREITSFLLGRVTLQVQEQRPSRGSDNHEFLLKVFFEFKAIPWLSIDAYYEYRKNNSDSPGGDYFVNKGVIGLKVEF